MPPENGEAPAGDFILQRLVSCLIKQTAVQLQTGVSWGWRDGSVGKVLARQAEGPRSGFPSTHIKDRQGSAHVKPPVLRGVRQRLPGACWPAGEVLVQ